MWKRHPEVLVVGAGPVGLVTALALAERRHEIEIIDAEWRTGTHSYALALHGSTVGLLAELGLAEPILEKAFKVASVGLYDRAERRGELRFSELSSGFPFIAVLPQNELESVLEDALDRAGVKVYWNHRLRVLERDGERMHFEIDELEKESTGYGFAKTEWVVSRVRKGDAAFVVGADGFRSGVRRLAEIPFESHGPETNFAVFELETKTDVPAEMRLVFDDRFTSVYWPMGPRHCRWSFQLHPQEAPAEEERAKARLMVEVGGNYYPFLNPTELHRLLAERAPWFTAEIDAIHWSTAVSFHSRLARNFAKGGAWLVGDSAHVTGPAGIQSMNVGFREGLELARNLSGVLRGERRESELGAFEEGRLAEWRRLLGVEGGVAAGPKATDWMASRGPRLLPCVPASGTDLSALLFQVGLELR